MSTADVLNLVPLYALAFVVTVGRKIYGPNSGRIGDLHLAPRQRVSEMRLVIMALMPDAWRKRATQNPLLLVFAKSLADGFAFPARG